MNITTDHDKGQGFGELDMTRPLFKTEIEWMQAFDRAKDARRLSEGYGVSVVVIACELCHVMYERGRNDGRRVTVNDRKEAVRHLFETHGIKA